MPHPNRKRNLRARTSYHLGIAKVLSKEGEKNAKESKMKLPRRKGPRGKVVRNTNDLVNPTNQMTKKRNDKWSL